ncbi:MAG: hypothetical protein ACR2OM_07275 [Aestuariivirgaceae bacterium]
MKKLILSAAMVLALTAGAHAGQCPNLMQKVDEAMSSAQLSEADKAKVMELRAQGETQHAAGQHAESVASLNEALQLLGM